MLAVPLTNFFPCRAGVAVKKSLACGNKSGRAESALDRPANYKGPLKSMEVFGGPDTFNCRDLRIFRNVLPFRDA